MCRRQHLTSAEACVDGESFISLTTGKRCSDDGEVASLVATGKRMGRKSRVCNLVTARISGSVQSCPGTKCINDPGAKGGIDPSPEEAKHGKQLVDV